MISKDLQDVLTVSGWAMWLRFCKHNNVKMTDGQWPEYDVNAFMNILDITDETVLKEEVAPFAADQTIHGSKLGEQNG